MDKPYGVPPDFAEHFKLMSDMITIAFQADMTRVLTFLMTREGTSRSYREIGIADGHHPCTHHQGKPDLMEKVTQINEYHTKQLAGWLQNLKSIKEGDGCLLDNSMIVYGAGLSDGNRHLHEDLPTLLIGTRRQPLQAGPPRDLPQGNADVQFPSDADGSDGRADGELRRRVGPARAGEPDLAVRRHTLSSRMQQPTGRGAARPPIGIAFDGDLGNRIDAMLAVAMLNGFTAKTEARRISLSVSQPSLISAQLADVVATFYRGRPAGAPRGGVGAITEGMIGMPEGRGPADDKPALAALLSKKSRRRHAALQQPDQRSRQHGRERGSHPEPAARPARRERGHRARRPGDRSRPAPRPVSLRAADHGEVQAAGRRRRIVPGGAARTATIKSDVAAARKLFAEWPTPIVAVGSEVGDALPYPGASIEKDFAWAPAHPVVDAYRALKPMPYDAPAAALAAVLYAVHPDDGYFKLSEPGTISVLDDGRTRFTPAADGKHRYLIVDPAQKDRVITVYSAMVSAAPAPRPGRRRDEGHRNETSRRCCRSRVERARPGREHQVVRAGACRQCKQAGTGRCRSSRGAVPSPHAAAACGEGAPRTSRQAPRRLPPSPSRCSRRPAASVTTPPTSPAGSTSASITSVESLAADRDRWDSILTKLKSQEMPPEDVLRPDAGDQRPW